MAQMSARQSSWLRPAASVCFRVHTRYCSRLRSCLLVNLSPPTHHVLAKRERATVCRPRCDLLRERSAAGFYTIIDVCTCRELPSRAVGNKPNLVGFLRRWKSAGPGEEKLSELATISAPTSHVKSALAPWGPHSTAQYCTLHDAAAAGSGGSMM